MSINPQELHAKFNGLLDLVEEGTQFIVMPEGRRALDDFTSALDSYIAKFNLFLPEFEVEFESPKDRKLVVKQMFRSSSNVAITYSLVLTKRGLTFRTTNDLGNKLINTIKLMATKRIKTRINLPQPIKKVEEIKPTVVDKDFVTLFDIISTKTKSKEDKEVKYGKRLKKLTRLSESNFKDFTEAYELFRRIALVSVFRKGEKSRFAEVLANVKDKYGI